MHIGANLTYSFVLSNITIAATVLQLQSSTSTRAGRKPSVQGKATSIQTAGIGVFIANSSYVILDGGGANPNGAGVETGAGRINKHQTGAIDVENSNHITIRGWQMSASGPSFQPNWGTLDPSVAYWARWRPLLWGHQLCHRP